MPPAKPKKDASPGRKGLELQDIQAFLSRFQVSGVNWNDFPPPPEGKLERGLLTALGAGTTLVGLALLALGLVYLNGVFVAAAMALAGLGTAGTLYVQPDLALARRPLASHPSSRDGEVRSAWETALTTAAVLGFLNAGLGILLCAALYTVVHWGASLVGALVLNALGLYVGYIGDGENRRPILPEEPGQDVPVEGGEPAT